MKTKVSKAQIEVWDWKENLYEELKDIPKLERLNYIKSKVNETIRSLKKKKLQSLKVQLKPGSYLQYLKNFKTIIHINIPFI